MMDPRQIAAAAAALLFAAAPAAAGTLQFWEDRSGAPGVTAVFPTATGLVADIAYDADTAEGGGLLYGPTEIEIRPTGTVSFVGFSCHFPNCTQNSDYVFVPGDASQGGKILVSDTRFSEQHGIQDLGAIAFDAQEQPGSIELVTCNYTDIDGQQHRCSSFTLVTLPESGALAMLGSGAALLAALSRASSLRSMWCRNRASRRIASTV